MKVIRLQDYITARAAKQDAKANSYCSESRLAGLSHGAARTLFEDSVANTRSSPTNRA